MDDCKIEVLFKAVSNLNKQATSLIKYSKRHKMKQVFFHIIDQIQEQKPMKKTKKLIKKLNQQNQSEVEFELKSMGEEIIEPLLVQLSEERSDYKREVFYKALLNLGDKLVPVCFDIIEECLAKNNHKELLLTAKNVLNMHYVNVINKA